jgi:hypothetical protein
MRLIFIDEIFKVFIYPPTILSKSVKQEITIRARERILE